jgi:A/G-specific adenine glycosylase
MRYNNIREALEAKRREPLCVGPAHGGTVSPSQRRMNTIQRRLLVWFEAADRGFPWRKRTATKYEQVIAEVLLQRTKADVVARMFRSFTCRYSSWSRLSVATQQELEDVLRPLGLWRRRANSLKALAGVMASRRGRYPKEREEVESLPGVGQYICNAILMFDQGHNQPLLDVNLARVLERVFGPRRLSDIRYDPYLQDIALRIVQHDEPTRVNWAFLDLAAMICTIRNPKCPECPLNKTCCYASTIRESLDHTSRKAEFPSSAKRSATGQFEETNRSRPSELVSRTTK